jgi:hypothetical protein
MMRLVRSTEITFQSDALRRNYQQRVRRKLAAILQQLELGADANLGLHASEWWPDPDTKVNFNISAGVTEQIIRVHVTHVERHGEQEDVPKKKKVEYKPYLWLGATAVNHSGAIEGEFNTIVAPLIYGFEPEPEDGYNMGTSVEDCEGVGQWDYESSWDWPALLPGDVGGYFAEGAGDLSRWIVIAGYEWASWSDGAPFNQPHAEVATCLDTSVYTTDDFNAIGKVSWSNMILLSNLATQLIAPDAAFAGDDGLELPLHYWQRSVVVDPEGIRARDGRKPEILNFSDAWWANVANGVVVGVERDGEQVVSTVLPGLYRFEIAATGCDCHVTCCGHTQKADIKIRLILGRGSLETGDPDGELEGAPGGGVTVVDFDCEGIGNVNALTTLNACRANTVPLTGFHPWSSSTNSVINPNPADRGFWDQMLMVNIQTGTYELVNFERDFEHFHGAAITVDDQCECDDEQGGAPADWNGGATGIRSTILNIRVAATGKIVTYNINRFLIWQLATVIWTCDGAIEAVTLIGNRGQGCGPTYGEGASYYATGYSYDPTGAEPSKSILTGWSVGELVMVIGAHTATERLYVTKPDPFFLGYEWGVDHRCPNGSVWSSQIKPDARDDGLNNLRFDSATGLYIPDPIVWHYDVSTRGWKLGGPADPG